MAKVLENNKEIPKLRLFFMKKWHNIVNFHNSQKSLPNFAPLHDVVIWCKFQTIWSKLEGTDTFGIKVLKM